LAYFKKEHLDITAF